MKKQNLKKLLKKQRGAEMLQVVLISGVLLVLIITLFYPQIQGLFENMMGKMTNWFNNAGSSIFTI